MWKIPIFWLEKTLISYLLWPISLVFLFIISLRRWYWQYLKGRGTPPKVPVIIVGNHWIGGTGKTPIVIALAQHLREQGLKVGIVSRAYEYQAQKNQSQIFDTQNPIPFEVKADEIRLIWQSMKTKEQIDSPSVFIGTGQDRYYLYEQLTNTPYHCDVIISDDGLQHYALPRTLELVVFDERGIGNGFIFPAGGLREPIRWLKNRILVCRETLPSVPAKAIFLTRRHITHAYPLKQFKLRHKGLLPLSIWNHHSVTAIAAIGHPQAFFTELSTYGLVVEGIALPDHSVIPTDLLTSIHTDIFITEKDAVKSVFWMQGMQEERNTASEAVLDHIEKHVWVVPLSLMLPDTLLDLINDTVHSDHDQ
jgi:tetraacyldisaccharide 4'-kinase